MYKILKEALQQSKNRLLVDPCQYRTGDQKVFVHVFCQDIESFKKVNKALKRFSKDIFGEERGLNMNTRSYFVGVTDSVYAENLAAHIVNHLNANGFFTSSYIL